jgi:hypothetical protein
MFWCHGDADTRGYVDLIAFNDKRSGDDIDNPVRKPAGIAVPIVLPVLHDSELVAAQPREYVCFPKRSLETQRRFQQHLVANGMS